MRVSNHEARDSGAFIHRSRVYPRSDDYVASPASRTCGDAPSRSSG